MNNENEKSDFVKKIEGCMITIKKSEETMQCMSQPTEKDENNIQNYLMFILFIQQQLNEFEKQTDIDKIKIVLGFLIICRFINYE
jgi:hypothetical protein